MPSPPSTSAQPVAERERIAALDVLRGFALLGILIMNVQAFSMPGAAYTNPAAFGDLSGINRAVWVLSHIGADQKFMAIFSMLFGAGVCLFSDRAVAKTGSAAKLYYRRMGVLLAVGVAHGYLLFHGDVLVAYALCGLWVFALRNKRPRTLTIVAFALLLVAPLISAFVAVSIPHMPKEATDAMSAGWAPPPKILIANIEGMRGSFAEQVATRAPLTLTLQTTVFVLFFLWRVSGMMLLGMALYKTGVLSGRMETSWYRRVAVIALPVGIAVSTWGVVQNFEHEWSFEYSMFLGSIPNYWGSIAVAMGYTSLVMIAVRAKFLPPVQRLLAAAGRMAFTNYLMQSLLCVFVFNELELFGAMPRWQQPFVVLAIWSVQLYCSNAWLERYRYGPLEWLWRSATYGRLQPQG